MKRNRKWHRVISLLLAAVMVLSLMQARGWTGTVYAGEIEQAEEQPDTGNTGDDVILEASATETYVPDASGLPDSDELFAGYAMQVFYGDSGVALLSNFGEAELDGYNLIFYRALKEGVADLAAKGGKAQVVVDLGNHPISWPSTGNNEDYQAEIDTAIANNGIVLDRIMSCLLADCPYELYWYDKTAGVKMESNAVFSGSIGNFTGSISSFTFTFEVSEEYRGISTDPDVQAVDGDKAGATAGAANAARKIAADFNGYSDYAKMIAFRDAICNLVDYNAAAAGESYTDGYGDPWQLIYVFDGDDSTNVVCEGYAKAFQYLCDLSGLTCYTVTGMMDGGTGEGPHMWNIVTLGDENYLVDVTNSDDGTVGQNGGLFLAGYDSGSWNESYTFRAGGSYIAYAYDPDQRTLYGKEILTLSNADYNAAGTEQEMEVRVSGPEGGSVQYGTAPQLQVTVEGLSNPGTITYQWYQVNEYGVPQLITGANAATYTPTGLALGDYIYYCLVTCDGYEVTSPQVTVTVEQAVLTPSIQGNTIKTYDGNMNAPSGLSISLSGIVGNEAVTASATSYSYNSKDVLTASTITASGITLSGTNSGNYKLASDTATVLGSITPRSITVTPESGQSKAYGANDPVLTYDITTGSLISGDTLQGALSRAEGENVGNYEITIGTLANPNYSITLTPGVTFAITRGTDLTHAAVTVVGTYTYDNGNAIVPDVQVVLGGVELTAGEDYTVSATNNINAGTANYTVTGTGGYTGSRNGTFEIGKADPVYNAPSGLTAEYGTQLSTITLTNPNTNTPGTWQWVTGSATINRVGDASYNAVFTPTDTDNYNSPTEAVAVTVTGTDSVAPTGVITIEGNSWREFLNSITFGYFFKDTLDVTITGADNTETAVAIEYFLTDTEQTEASLENVGWKEYSQVLHIEENQKLIVYARITDLSDNSTVISSDGIVLYTDAGADTDTESITYTRTSGDDVTAQVSLNGNTVAGITNGNNSLRTGTDYSVSDDGTITFESSYLQTLAAGNYTLTVSYNPLGVTYENRDGNEAPATTSLSLEVVRAQSSVSNISNLSKTYDSTPVAAPTYNVAGTGAMTVEYKEQGAADSTYSTTAPEDAGDYTVRVSVAANDDYAAASATRDFTISRRSVTVTGASVEETKIYDGTTSAAVTSSGTLSGAVSGDEVSITQGTAAYDNKNAGTNKTVTFTGFGLTGSDADNYNLTGQPAPVQAAITQKVLTVDVDVFDKVYDGTDTAEIESAVLEGVIPGDDVSLTNGTPIFTSTKVGQDIPIQFTTAFSISGADAGNYTLIQPTGVTANIAEYVAVEGTDYTVNSNDWLNEDFIVTAGEDRLLSTDAGAADGNWTETLSASDETDAGSLVFYVMNTETGAISTAVEEEYQIDKTVPTGTLSIGENSWTSLQDVDSFELFFGADQEVDVAAADTLSGIASSEYYVSTEVLSGQEVEGLEDWSDYDALTMDQEGQYIVYVKLTDNAGNTAYLSSDGIVLDKTAPEITGIEDDGTYYGGVSFTVSDDYLAGVTVDGRAVQPTDGVYTIQADNDTHTVIATDRAGTATTYEIGVYEIYTVTLPASPEGYTVQTDADQVNYGGSYEFTVDISEGYSATEDFAVSVNGIPVTVQADGSYLVTGVQADQVVTVSGVADITAPDAEIEVGENIWTSFLNTITFGLFFDEGQTVEISASDVGSGVEAVQYYVSETALSEEEVRARPDTAWNDYSDTFSLDSEQEYVVYTKVTDAAGNTAYISSDGMVIDLTAPVVTGLTDGATYYNSVSFTVEDDYFDRVTVDGTPVALTDSGYTIQADNEQHVVTAYDRAGNSRTYHINVYRTYTITFVADGEIVDTMTAGYGDSLGADDYPEVPEKEGYTQISPVWYPGAVSSVTGDMTVTAVYFTDSAAELPQPGTADGTDMKLIVEQGVPTIPEALEGNEALDTAEEIGAALQTVLSRLDEDVTEENTALYDVTLMVDLHDGNGWIPAGPEHFGADGTLKVTLPYPEGTGRDTHDFTVAHMFTMSDFGKTPGDIETPEVEKTEDGIRFTVTGLSPIMVSWTEVPEDEGTVQSPESGADQGGTSGTEESGGENVPATGDDGSARIMYTALAVCVSGMLAALMLYRKRKNNSDR